MRRLLAISLAGYALAGCTDIERTEVEFPLYVAGADTAEPFRVASGVEVQLERAELAFGPLYLCAGFQAGTRCDTARAEWLGSAVVHATRVEARLAGEVTGVSGAVNSWMYDLGFSSLLTREEPLALAAVDALGGVSLRIEGTAALDAGPLPFLAELAIRQNSETELGVPVVRKSTNDEFGRELTAGESGLLVRFDPRAWLFSVDFEALAESESCALREPGAPCSIAPGTQAHRAIDNSVTAGVRPEFTWGFSP